MAGFLFLCLMWGHQVWVVHELSMSCLWVVMQLDDVQFDPTCWGEEAACNADAMLTKNGMPEAGWGTSVRSMFLVRGVWGHGPKKNWDFGSVCSFVVEINLEHSNCSWPVQWIVPALEQAPKKNAHVVAKGSRASVSEDSTSVQLTQELIATWLMSSTTIHNLLL